jgi:hypothetical protein
LEAFIKGKTGASKRTPTPANSSKHEAKKNNQHQKHVNHQKKNLRQTQDRSQNLEARRKQETCRDRRERLLLRIRSVVEE